MPDKVEVEVGDRKLQLSNLDKVLYPATGFTKAQVIDYYVRVAPAMLTHIGDRGITLIRYPDGVDGNSFFFEALRRLAPRLGGGPCRTRP